MMITVEMAYKILTKNGFFTTKENVRGKVIRFFLLTRTMIDYEKKDKPETKEMNGRTYYKRDSRVAKRAIVASKYSCEVDGYRKKSSLGQLH